MSGAERIVVALRPLGEAGQAVFHPQGADTVTAAGQDLVRIGLMPDIPDKPVIRRVENIVQGNGEFDHAETGAKVPAGVGNHVDQFGAQLPGQLAEIAFGQGAKIGRDADLIEKGRSWS